MDVAVDSAFPRAPIDLIGMSIAPIAAAYAVTGPTPLRSVKRLVLYAVDDQLKPETVSLRARIEERRILVELMEKYRPKVALIDGEIVPLKLIRLSKELRELTDVMLEKAKLRHITVIGVVKRSKTRFLSKILNVNANDKAIAAYALSPCEAIIIDHPSGVLRERGCKLVIYKPPRGPAAAVKLEVCGSLEEAARHACSAGWSGLPWLADLVDALAKAEAERLIRLVDSKVRGLLGAHGVVELALPVNPQEGSQPRARNE